MLPDACSSRPSPDFCLMLQPPPAGIMCHLLDMRGSPDKPYLPHVQVRARGAPLCLVPADQHACMPPPWPRVNSYKLRR